MSRLKMSRIFKITVTVLPIVYWLNLTKLLCTEPFDYISIIILMKGEYKHMHFLQAIYKIIRKKPREQTRVAPEAKLVKKEA